MNKKILLGVVGVGVVGGLLFWKMGLKSSDFECTEANVGVLNYNLQQMVAKGDIAQDAYLKAVMSLSKEYGDGMSDSKNACEISLKLHKKLEVAPSL